MTTNAEITTKTSHLPGFLVHTTTVHLTFQDPYDDGWWVKRNREWIGIRQWRIERLYEELIET